MKRIVSLAALSLGILCLGVVADEASDQIKAFEEGMKTADEAGKVRLIEELAGSGNPGASKAISRYMTDRSTAVKVAAIKAIGTLKEKKYYGKLMGLMKAYDKEPKVLAAVLQAIGEYGNRASLKELVKLAKKWLYKDSEVASTAARAIGKIPTRDAVDALIELMDLTFPSQAGSSSGGSGKAVSAETRKLLEESRPAVLEGLQTLTGWDFRHPAAWKKFWDMEGRRWKPADKDPDFTKIETWRDPGYGFEITKPADRWEMARGKDLGKDYEEYRIVVRQIDEGMVRAYVYVWAAENVWGYTTQSRADKSMDHYKETWEDVKEESFKEKEIKVGRVSGIEQTFTGMDAAKNVCSIRNRYFVVGEMVFIVYGWSRSGTPSDVIEELDELIESFKVYD
jgi:hypothetical protein